MNLKLNLKVLVQMMEDFDAQHARVLRMRDGDIKKKLIEEIKEKKKAILTLHNHYQKVLNIVQQQDSD